jgi:hypothetical protein
MIIVKVYYESSEHPAAGKIVSIGAAGLKGPIRQFTDDNGEALFNVEPQEGRVFIFVNGAIAYKGYLRERIIVYV